VTDSRPRLFVAFRLPESVVVPITEWQRRHIAGARGARPLPAEHFHITAVFLGSQSPDALRGIRDTVARVTAEFRRPVFRVDRYRETSRVGMLALREDPLPGERWAGRGVELAGRLMRAFESAGICKREHRAWRPHITVARFRDAPRIGAEPPSLPPFQPTDVTLFQSLFGGAGSTYAALDSAPFAPDV
jgi:2'-5' RNA ligase